MSTTTKKTPAKTQPVSGRAQRKRQEARQAKMRKLTFVGGAVALALIVVVALILLNRDSGGGGSDLPPITAAAALDPSIPRNGRVLGDPNAPVTIVEYLDFQCPACGQFASTIMPQLINDYIKTGKVKLESRDMAFLDDRTSDYGESDMAAEAAGCALDQGKYWGYHDTLFANQHGENEGAFSKERLKQIAQAIGLDTNAFNSCFGDRKHKDDVANMKALATQDQVSKTPTIFINGKEVNFGSYADLKAEIDAALAG